MLSIAFLDSLREAELETAVRELRAGARILEFGAGTGAQAKQLAEQGFDVVAIDLASSGYAQSRIYPVIDYDGSTIPLDDDAVDIVFSSNVLEHVGNLARIFDEFRRVTRPDGYGVHIMPSVPWRAWTFATGFPNAAVVAASALSQLIRPRNGNSRAAMAKRHAKLFAGSILPIGHGTSIEGVSELWTFSARAWRRRFERHGFSVDQELPIGLFHTGHSLFGPALGVERRRRLAGTLGSSATLFVVRPAG